MTILLPPEAPAAGKPGWRRLLPLLIILAALAALLASGAWRHLNLETLQDNRAALEAFVADNLLVAVLVYTVIYALAVSISVPGAIWFTIGAGFLFGPFTGAAIAVTGSTIGATIIFLAVRYGLADWAWARFNTWARRLQQGLSSNAFSYVLILRLIPVLPFFGINIAMALLNLPLRPYVAGTFLGVMPLAYVYATVGSTIGQIAGGVPDFLDLVTPELVAAMAVFALVGFVPFLYNRLTGNKPPAADGGTQ